MKAITVRQPHAWAIIHGGKDIENRPRNLVGDYRGPILIHAGLGPFDRDTLSSQTHRAAHGTETDTQLRFGAIIGIVDLTPLHQVRPGCCDSPWGQPNAKVHLELANPRPLPKPIPARGFLHFWTPTVAAIAQIEEQLR